MVMQNGAKLGIADITEYLTTTKLTHFISTWLRIFPENSS